jgi:sugar/nucleoside kinase (ribokinase family)
MIGERGSGVIVAGHLCLDLIPTLPGEVRYTPGTLASVGPVTVSTGGCVPNTGLALHRLGAPVRLLAKVADDPLGKIVRDLLARVSDDLAEGLLDAPSENTSYSVILSPPGEDRMILHHPGPNDTFAAEDLPEDLEDVLPEARIFHFGYPPIMRRMYEDSGENLRRVLNRAKHSGLTTSLDTTYPDPASEAGRADWGRVFETALPEADVFLPSLEEILLMLEPDARVEAARRGPEALSRVPVERISHVGNRLVALGAAVVGIKCGARGLYLRTAPEERLKDAGPAFPGDRRAWADRELWSSAFEVRAIGTTGAGDAAVAGFLRGLLGGLPPEENVTIACAVGASSVEAADATSGVRSWEETRERFADNRKRSTVPPGEGWREGELPGVWIGPHDRGS